MITSSLIKGLYTPKSFINHAASLRQAFAHCGIFSAAATRRCLDRVAVPTVGIRLSPPLCVIALVGHYPTNKLIQNRPIPKRQSFTLARLSSIINDFSKLSLTLGYVPIHYYLVCHDLQRDHSTCMPYPRRQRSS